MIVKNVRHQLKLLLATWQMARRFDVLIERGVTFKYGETVSFGKKCTVQSGAYVYGSPHGKTVRFGDHVVVSWASMVLGTGGVVVGDYTHLGPNVVITTQYGDSQSDPCVAAPTVKYGEVRIGRGCWLGSGSVIMPGTVLGDGCIVAPNSVVYGRWGDRAKLSGNPARPMRG